MPDLLIELFSEEIPARMQARASDDLRRLITDGLVEGGLSYTHAGSFSTPRRLTLVVEGLGTHSKATCEERKGPKTNAPEAAIEGFLRKTGLTRDQLEVRDDKKAQVYYALIETPGRLAEDIIAETLENTIRNFPWPKSMRWGSGSLRWVRPLHSILCLLYDEAGALPVNVSIDGITSTDSTYGHRFMAPELFEVSSFDDYMIKLKRAYVVLDRNERQDKIWQGVQNLSFAAGLEPVEDKALLAEVAGLVEWPVPLVGKIDDVFLKLPPEVLQTSMKEHQKFFSLKNIKSKRIEGFATIANIAAQDGGETILAGNQKVLSARLFDAKFFWENDLRIATTGMKEWENGLKTVTFHNKLGSQADRIARIGALARELAVLVGADVEQSTRAAKLSKLDLRSEMVGEFPELQGVMGRYYALSAGEAAAVADAVRDHYSPLGPSDDVPNAPVSIVTALSDKLDMLTGFWAIDETPTGSKDPFALRRAALGVIRLILNNNLKISLRPLLLENIAFADALRRKVAKMPNEAAKQAFLDDLKRFERGGGDATLPVVMQETYEQVSQKAADLMTFFHDRLKVFLRDQGIRHDVIDACLIMPNADDLNILVKRIRALQEFLSTCDAQNLVQTFKRANNILSQAEEKDGVEYSYGADLKYTENEKERTLFHALDRAEPAIDRALQQQDFLSAMQAVASLRIAVDDFFLAVQINTDNQIIRRNRLNLLSRIRAAGMKVADLTLLEG